MVIKKRLFENAFASSQEIEDDEEDETLQHDNDDQQSESDEEQMGNSPCVTQNEVIKLSSIACLINNCLMRPSKISRIIKTNVIVISAKVKLRWITLAEV